LARQVPTLAVKLGPQGALVRQRDVVYTAPPLAVDVVDTTGAGDSFNAGFLYGFINQWSPVEALRLATVCGSLSTRAPGGTTAQPTLVEARQLGLQAPGVT
jgi:sugar/nucleoside kinase (ribokinase family)